MSNGKKIGGIILVILGTIGLVIGIAIGALFGVMNGVMGEAIDEVNQQVEDARLTGVSTYGEITDIDSDGVATIEFYCEEEGSWYEMSMTVLSDEYGEGSTVEVIYDPDEMYNADYVPIVPELYQANAGMVGYAMPVGIGVGVFFGIVGVIMLIIGIVLLVSNKKDKKWVDEINARNAAQGIGAAPYNGYGQPQGGQPMNGYGQPQGGQPISGYSQSQNGGQTQSGGNTSNPYQQ